MTAEQVEHAKYIEKITNIKLEKTLEMYGLDYVNVTDAEHDMLNKVDLEYSKDGKQVFAQVKYRYNNEQDDIRSTYREFDALENGENLADYQICIDADMPYEKANYLFSIDRIGVMDLNVIRELLREHRITYAIDLDRVMLEKVYNRHLKYVWYGKESFLCDANDPSSFIILRRKGDMVFYPYLLNEILGKDFIQKY